MQITIYSIDKCYRLKPVRRVEPLLQAEYIVGYSTPPSPLLKVNVQT
jgi:hypothetical protein